MVDAAVLENDRLRLALLPDFGARVIALEDVRSGRQWLTTGTPRARVGDEDAVFGGADAYGWDECFPTILSGDAVPQPWPRARFRDHGDLWGRPWRVSRLERDTAVAELEFESMDGVYVFVRRIELHGGMILIRYLLRSSHDVSLPFQWAMHPCFDLKPGERVLLPGVRKAVRVGYLPGDPPFETVDWPGPDALDVVRDSDARLGIKVYAGPIEDRRAAVGAEDGWLSIRWDAPFSSFLGIWLDYGAWPVDSPIHQVAIEPMTSPTHDLARAVDVGSAPMLEPGQELAWEVQLSLDETWPSGSSGPGLRDPRA